MNVERWDTCEFAFRSQTEYDNPFTQNMTSADGELVLVTSSVTGFRQVHFID